MPQRGLNQPSLDEPKSSTLPTELTELSITFEVLFWWNCTGKSNFKIAEKMLSINTYASLKNWTIHQFIETISKKLGPDIILVNSILTSNNSFESNSLPNFSQLCFKKSKKILKNPFRTFPWAFTIFILNTMKSHNPHQTNSYSSVLTSERKRYRKMMDRRRLQLNYFSAKEIPIELSAMNQK